jgi:hypothetical protein
MNITDNYSGWGNVGAKPLSSPILCISILLSFTSPGGINFMHFQEALFWQNVIGVREWKIKINRIIVIAQLHNWKFMDYNDCTHFSWITMTVHISLLITTLLLGTDKNIAHGHTLNVHVSKEREVSKKN